MTATTRLTVPSAPAAAGQAGPQSASGRRHPAQPPAGTSPAERSAGGQPRPEPAPGAQRGAGERTAVEELTAEHVMSRVLIAVEPGESPLMAWELMCRAGVHHLPVVQGRHVLGVLSSEDLAATWSGGPREQSARQVGSLLAGRRKPRVQPGTPLKRVAAVMLDAGCDAVPVVRDGGIVGLITARDVLAAVAGRARPATEQSELVTGLFRLQPLLP